MLDAHYLCFLLTYGFLAKVFTGLTLSPAGVFATKVLVPALGNPTKLVAEPPKRFAQIIGLVVAGTATILIFAFGLELYGKMRLLILTAFAVAESVRGFCFGCYVFGHVMTLVVIPEEICFLMCQLGLDPI